MAITAFAPFAARKPITHSFVLMALLLVSTACSGNGSSTADSATIAEPAGGAITLWTDSTELFMEHPALIVGAPD
jgi:ABC-type glycerol-3-phosphate transport system substrate-binding protein